MEIVALMLVGAVVGRSGRYLFEVRRIGDGVIAMFVGIMGAMLAAAAVTTLDLRPNFGGLLLISAVGAMAFFSIYRFTTVPSGQRDVR